MSQNIGPKIGVQGEGEFRKSIANINNNLKTLTAETQAVTSAFIGNEKSMEALTAKSDMLSKRSEALNEKLDAQRQRLKELDDAGVDPTSASYQKLQQDIYKTETELNKNEAELRDTEKAMNDLENGADEAGEEVKDLGEKGEKTGSTLKANLASAAIVAGVKALASAIKEGVKALGDMILKSAQAADELNTLSVKTGLSTNELQRFQYASDLIDVSVDTLTGSMTKLIKNMDSARSGSGAAADAFKQLGVEVTNEDGSLRDRNEVFNEAISALGRMTDETERDLLAMDLFGKSATELNPLILGGADALKQLGDEAEAAGLILSQDALDELNSVSDAMDTLKATTGAAGKVLTAAFAGPAASALNTLTGYVTKLVQAFQKQDWKAIGDIIQEAVGEAATVLSNFLPEALNFGLDVILSISEGIISHLGEIVSAALSVVLSLATGISDHLGELIPTIIDVVLQIVDTLTDPDTLVNLVEAAIAIIIALANGLISALPKLLAKAPEIVENLVEAVVRAAPLLLTAALELVVTIGRGIIDNLGEMAKAAGRIINALLDGLRSLLSSFASIGGDIVRGIWKGISDGYGWIKGKIEGWVGDIVSFFKKILGIASPSKVFAGIGDNMAAGIGVGFDRSMDKVERDMMSSIPTEFNTTVTGGTGASAGVFGTAPVEEITIPVMVGDVELARVLYRHIVGEGERLGAPAIA